MKAKKLSKAQLKKLKGGILGCSDVTRCHLDTCGGMASKDHCSDVSPASTSLTDTGGSGSVKQTKK